MGKFVKGDIVVVPLPFSDLSSSKRRPALVLAEASADDLILAQITSQSFSDIYAVEIDSNDFSEGGLRVPSNVRPTKLFTAESNIIVYKAGRLRSEKTREIVTTIVALLLSET